VDQATGEVRFENPPLKEVSLAVGIEPITNFTTVRMLELWTAAFREQYPIVEEQSIAVRIEPETFDPRAGARLTISAEMFEPSPRLWFLDAERRHLIQIQRDLFARNWRKEDSDEVYPGFPILLDQFKASLERFDRFLTDSKVGGLQPIQVEVSYINHIPSNGTDQLTLSTLLKTVNGVVVDGLPRQEDEQYSANYVIGDNQGRLRVSASTGRRRDNLQRLLVFNLIARGAPFQPTVDGVLEFARLGSEVATQAFVGLTSPEMQSRWGRRDG
jgi:uncharacterized protein (TIGR04255 family)